MSPIRILGLAAAAALFAAPAFADPDNQGAAQSDPNMTPASAPMPNQASAPAATSPGNSVNANGVILQSSPTPPDQAYTLKAGDPSVVSNAPVADTPENRAKYGRPMSNAGKRTAAAGN